MSCSTDNMHLQDTLRFFRKLTIRKAWNALKILSSYYYSRLDKGFQPLGQPITLSVEPTTACNLRCPECPSGLRSFTRPTGTLDSSLFEKLLKQTYRDLIYLIFYFQGEPYIHPKFLEMVSEAHRHGVYTITSTNGHFLNEENARATVESGLDRLIISIDGASQAVYEQYRVGGKLDNVLQGARNVVKWKRALGANAPHIIFQCLVVRPNEDDVDQIRHIAKEIGVDEVVLKSAQLYEYENGHELMPRQAKFNRYRQSEDGTWNLKRKTNDECWKMWHASLMTWDGMILPCCFDKDGKHSMGNINQMTFDQIWKSPTYNDFRERIREGRDQIDICRNCSEGCKVWLS